jgi:hypothetical protein
MVITVRLDSVHAGGKVFFNDTVLEWLRAGVDRATRPYTILDVPRIDSVEQVEVTGDLFRDSPAGGMSDAGGRGVPVVRGPASAPRSSRDEAPGRTPSAGAGRDKPNTLEGLSPLEPMPPRSPEGAKVYRYTVRWLVGLEERPLPAAPAGAGSAPEASAFGSGEVTS